MVVEDESIVAMELKDRLNVLGYESFGAFSSGEQALAKVGEILPDLILMDIMLKGKLDGIQTAQKIREKYNIPSVYLTAYSDNHTLQRAKITGPFGYLLKPFEERELHTTIEMALYKFKMDKKLVESEKWFSTTLKSIGDAIIATDAQGKIKLLNPLAEELTGWRQEQAIGKDSTEVFKIIDDFSREPSENPVKKVLSTGEIFDLTNHTILISKYGNEVPIDDSAAPIKDNDGNITGVVLDFRDISDRKKAEKILRNSEIKFKSIFQSSNDAILITDFSGKIISCNQSTQKLFGYKDGEILNQPLVNLIPQNNNKENEPKKTASTGKMSLHGNVLEMKGCRKDKTTFPLELSLANWKTNEGSFLSYNIRDITGRKEAEKAIKQERDFVAAILDTAGVLVVVLNKNGQLVRSNKYWENLTGINREENYGQNYSDFFQSEVEILSYEENVQPMFNGKKHCKFEADLYRKNGDTKKILWNFVTLYDKTGRLEFIIGTGLDISEQRNLEAQFRQSQKMEAIGKLAGGIAHDFNNLLTAINGYSDLILDTLDSEDPINSDIQEIRQAGQQASDLTQQLLAFSRQQILDMKVVNLNDICRKVDRMLRRIIGENVTLITEQGDNLHTIKVDSGQIEQIILNLSINARDAMSDCGVLTIETQNIYLDAKYNQTHTSQKPGQYVMLAISDTGCGMTKEIKDRIFEPFFTTKEKGKGTGLGLSTVYGIVKQCGGFIWVYSEPNKGTTFKIYFPQSVENTEQTVNLKIQETYPYGSETILLAEDEKVVRDFSSRVLKKQGYDLLVAKNAKEALKIAADKNSNIKLLLTDVVMPDISGKELAGRLLKDHDKMKVLYMSGYTDHTIFHQGVLEKGIHFLQKPFSPSILVNKVRDVLDS